MILLSGTVRIRLVVKRRPRRSARRRRWRPRLARPNAPGSHASRPFWVVWVPVPRPGGRYTRVKPRQSASHANVKSKRCALRRTRVNRALPQARSGPGGGPKALYGTVCLIMAWPGRGGLACLRCHRRPALPGRLHSESPTPNRLTPGRLHCGPTLPSRPRSRLRPGPAHPGRLRPSGRAHRAFTTGRLIPTQILRTASPLGAYPGAGVSRRSGAAMAAAAAPGSGAPVMGRPITSRSAPARSASSGVAVRAWS